MHRGPRPGRPRPVHRLACDRDRPRRQERLRRLLEKQRDRDLQARRAHGQADPGHGHGRLHRRQRRRRLRAARSGSTARTRSRSAPTAATSTRPRCRATRSPSFARNPTTGALSQTPRRGAAARSRPADLRSARTGRALDGPDVVIVSPDGRNVYVGSFFGNAVAVFDRNRVDRRADPAAGRRRLHRRSAGAAARPASRCRAPEGLAISRRRRTVYVAAALSNAVARPDPRPVDRRPDPGHRRQRLHRQQRARRLHDRHAARGANAVAVSPDGEQRLRDLAVQQQRHLVHPHGDDRRPGPEDRDRGCLVFLRAVGCSFGRALSAPEGLAVSPDGGERLRRRLHIGRDRRPRSATGSRARSCRSRAAPAAWHRRRSRTARPAAPCAGVSSIAVSPDGRYLYSTAFGSDAVDVFRRVTRGSDMREPRSTPGPPA